MVIKFKLISLAFGTFLLFALTASCQTPNCQITEAERNRLLKRTRFEVKTQSQIETLKVSYKADSVVISGSVIDRFSGEPLPALIQIPEIKVGTTANSDGRFRLVVPKGIHKIEVIHLGNMTFNTEALKLENDTQLNVCLGTIVSK